MSDLGVVLQESPLPPRPVPEVLPDPAVRVLALLHHIEGVRGDVSTPMTITAEALSVFGYRGTVVDRALYQLAWAGLIRRPPRATGPIRLTFTVEPAPDPDRIAQLRRERAVRFRRHIEGEP